MVYKKLVNIIQIVLIAAIFFLFSSCLRNNIDVTDKDDLAPVLKTITAKEAFDMMNTLESFILLDVRTPAEFLEMKIEGAILIPDYEIRNRAEAELPDKSAVIFVYCRSGRRSASSAAVLAELGYLYVYDFGGILNWPYGTVFNVRFRNLLVNNT